MKKQNEPVFGIPDDLVIDGPMIEAAQVNWGMAACKIDELRQAGGDGAGELVAVLDTGIDRTHPEFGTRIMAVESFVPNSANDDGNGHGTHCAGTVAGGTPGVGVGQLTRLLSGKVLSNEGSGNQSWIRAGYEWAVRSGATIITMSIGGQGFLEGMEDLIAAAAEKGVITCVAAGNERAQGGVIGNSSAIVVAAVDSTGKYAPFSNPGRNVETLSIAAPGLGITSAWPGGGYNTISGTSMATPFTAGFIAIYQSARVKRGLSKLTMRQVKNVMLNRAIDAGPAGIDRDYGPGLLSGAAFVRSLNAFPSVAG